MYYKKISSILSILAITCIAFISCDKVNLPDIIKSDAEKIDEVIKKHDENNMTQDDYSFCIDIVDDYLQQSIRLIEDAVNDRKNDMDFNNKQNECKLIQCSCPQIDAIQNILSKATEQEMGKDNYYRYQKIQERTCDKITKIIELTAATRWLN